jgi:hypothetical protein
LRKRGKIIDDDIIINAADIEDGDRVEEDEDEDQLDDDEGLSKNQHHTLKDIDFDDGETNHYSEEAADKVSNSTRLKNS